MRTVEETAGPTGCPFLYNTNPVDIVCACAEHRRMLTASFILLVAQQDLLKLTTTRQTSGKLLLPSVLMPFSISTFTVIIIALIITNYRSSHVSVVSHCESGAKLL